MGHYLQGESGAIHYFDFEKLSDLPDWAIVQFKSGQLRKASVTDDEKIDLNFSLRPRDTDPRSRWFSYIRRAFHMHIDPVEERDLSKAEAIEWADSLERDGHR